MLVRLQAHAEQTGDKGELAEVLRLRAARESDPATRANLDIQATELFTQVCETRADAIAAWQSLVERHGPLAAALDHLIVLLEAENRISELAQAIVMRLGTTEGPARAPLLVRLAKLEASELGDESAAVQHFGDALAVDSKERTARGELTKYLEHPQFRASAVALLEPVLRSEEPSVLLLEVLRARAGELADVGQRLDAKVEAFQLASSKLGRLDEAFLLAVDGLGDAVSACPERIPEFVAACEETKEGVDAATRAGLLTEALGAVPLDTPERRAVAALVADALAESGETTRAIELLRRALAAEPSSPELLGRLDDLLAAKASPGERLALYTDALERAEGGERRLDILARMAGLTQRELGQKARAIELWQEVIAIDASHVGAHQALVTLFAEQGNDDRLEGELSRVLPFATGERYKKLLDRLVEVSSRTNGPKRALDYSLRSHEKPTVEDIPRIVRSEHLAKKLGRFDVIEHLLETRLSLVDERTQRIDLLAELGATRTQLKQSGAAAQAYIQAGAAAGELKQWERAAELFEAAMDADRDSEAIVFKLWDACARSSQIARLERPLAQLIALGTDERDLIRRLSDLSTRGLTAETAPGFARLVEMVLATSTDSARRRQLLLLRAEALSKNPETQQAASEIYRQLLDGISS
ncbi:MAG TPA: tetratricopeptide repeat protein, partial [Polyangiaceae bacterium]|nr:tetratricopeptide repeat protein [Polyangiaceae bacterium]